MKRVVFFLLGLFFVINAQLGIAQVSIAPSSIFISDQTNIGTIYVSNRSDEVQEVSVEFVFGYPSSDENGNVIMNYSDSIKKSQHALSDWLRVFPRSFVLGPQQQQTIRFQVRPQPQAEDGVYWTRVKIIANPQAPDIDLTTESEGITTRVTFRFEQIIAAFYKKGNTTTGVNVKNVEVRIDEDRLLLLPHLKRTGNSPFIGSIIAKMYDAGGNLVRERQMTTTAYFEEIRRVEFDAEGLAPGNYRVELTFKTQRSDISPTDLVQAPAITEVVEVRIP